MLYIISQFENQYQFLFFKEGNFFSLPEPDLSKELKSYYQTIKSYLRFQRYHKSISTVIIRINSICIEEVSLHK